MYAGVDNRHLYSGAVGRRPRASKLSFYWVVTQWGRINISPLFWVKSVVVRIVYEGAHRLVGADRDYVTTDFELCHLRGNQSGTVGFESNYFVLASGGFDVSRVIVGRRSGISGTGNLGSSGGRSSGNGGRSSGNGSASGAEGENHCHPGVANRVRTSLCDA